MLKSMLKSALGRIPSAFLERVLAYPVLRENYASVLHSPTLPDRESVWKELFDTHLQDGPICVLEFGVWQGDSMRRFVEFNRHADSVFFGFDSFEGLPDDWRPGYDRGRFSTAGTLPQIDDSRVRFIKGWFSRTLQPFLESQAELVQSIKSSRRRLFVHFDADLYSSTLCILANLAHYVGGYYCVFDEFTGDESRALQTASKVFDLKAEFYSQHKNPRTGYPWCVSGRIWKEV